MTHAGTVFVTRDLDL